MKNIIILFKNILKKIKIYPVTREIYFLLKNIKNKIFIINIPSINISQCVIPSSTPLYNINMKEEDILFYSYADIKYHPFAALYPIFALTSNPQSIVEICVASPNEFVNEYIDIINFYRKEFPGRILYSCIGHSDIFPNSLRFIVQPKSYAKYIYIGDIDILLLEDNILIKHIMNIKSNNLDFSNVVRHGTKKLTGLHFIEYDKMFPVQIDSNIDLRAAIDEELLYILMDAKGFKMPMCDKFMRPVHGLHISFFSRPLLPTLTTRDRIADFPVWGGDTEAFIEKYLEVRYAEPIMSFMSNIRDNNVALRRLVQIIDLYCLYCSTLPKQKVIASAG